MDRSREARRASGMVVASSNGGLSRRRHRSSNSLRDSPDEDGPVELQESVRLRERLVKKDRDPDGGDRERDREIIIERSSRSSSSKRRRGGERLMNIHGGGGIIREDGENDTSEDESVNDEEEDDEYEENNHHNGGIGGGSGVRLLPPNSAATNSAVGGGVGGSISNHYHHHHHQHLQHRKSFPPSAVPPAKVVRVVPVWKPGDEMIGVSVPRKARSASIKRSHDWISNSNGGVGVGGVEQSHLQASTSPSPSPVNPSMSPSSSNVSIRKKLKPNNNGLKQARPPKLSSAKASSSSNPEELEIEIAEVLYGLKTQSQAPKKEILSNNDSAEVNRSISNLPSTNIQSCSSVGPLSATALKRKRHRQVSETPKTEISSPKLEKISGSEVENGYDSGKLVNSQGVLSELPMPELMKSESEVKSAAAEGIGESRDVIPKEESISSSPRKEFPAEENDRVAAMAPVTKANSADEPEVDNQREEKFQIDLEAFPPQSRSSPEREREINLVGSAIDHKPVVMEEIKPVNGKDKEDEKVVKMGKEEAVIIGGAEEKKAKLTVVEESESQKRMESKLRNIDLQLDLEKLERDSKEGHKQQQPSKAAKEEPDWGKTGHSSSLPVPMSMASWPGGLPPVGYMAPIHGVVSMDGTTVSPAPIQQQPFFSQPRPKRCATHCYIARNIHYLQQLMKMNPFWPAAAAASSSSLFGSKPIMSVVPPADLHGSIPSRAVNSGQEKPGGGLTIFPGHGGMDKSPQPASVADANHRKQQMLMQQALPPTVAPNNILHGPAFIFPLSQQPAAVAAAVSARPGSVKPPTSSGNLASTSAAASTSAPAGGGAAAVSFNYPNMPTNETQYLAILQNNGYPFPIPAAVGAPPNYRGTHPQPLPVFNGSFYSSQIIHASQVQQAQQQSVSQSQQMQQQNHQNTSMSSGSSLSQKHLQSQQQQQQQRPTGSAVGGGNGSGNLHNFPAHKNRQSHPSQQQQNQQMNPSQSRQLENEAGAEDSPSTADSRGARGQVMHMYGQNFAMPIHPQNYALLATSAGLANAAATSSSNQSEKKKQQQHQHQAKNGVESLPAQAFAMSFASLNGANNGPGIDLSSMAQNHAMLQSFPEATRHNIQIMAATAAAQAAQRRNFRISEEGKTGGDDSSNTEDERKGGSSGKPPANSGQSIAFSRSEFADASGTTINNVVDSSSRSLDLASTPAWTARSTITNSLGAASFTNVQLQAQHHQQQQQHQQMMQLHKHQQQLAAARNKNPATSNGSVYPDHMTSTSSIAAKFPNSLSGIPQNPVQTSNSSSSPSQSPQWKNSARAANTSQAPSSFVTSTTSSLKNLQQQQQSRMQQSPTQISFGANQKTSAASQAQQGPSSVQSPSSPMRVGSPTTSISKGANGSPRTNSASASSKTGQTSSVSTQQAKNSSIPGQRSSPVGGRNVPSILGNPHIASTSNSGSKPQVQQQQQQMPKNMQQAQLLFSSPYFQSQSPQSTNTNASAASGGYYIQRRGPDQQQQPQHQQQPRGSSAPSSTAMLTLCPVSLAGAGTGTSDPAKAIAAATVAASKMKGGGGLPSQSILQAQFAAQSAGNQHQLLSAGFPYGHSVPAAVQAKPAEQKQPTGGNDNLHACWQPEKK